MSRPHYKYTKNVHFYAFCKSFIQFRKDLYRRKALIKLTTSKNTAEMKSDTSKIGCIHLGWICMCMFAVNDTLLRVLTHSLASILFILAPYTCNSISFHTAIFHTGGEAVEWKEGKGGGRRIYMREKEERAKIPLLYDVYKLFHFYTVTSDFADWYFVFLNWLFCGFMSKDGKAFKYSLKRLWRVYGN